MAGTASDAPTQSLLASADTYLRSGAANTNEGASTSLHVRASGDNRALVRFDQGELEAAVGSKVLVSATLSLDIASNGNNWGATGRTISVHALAADWTEGNGFNEDASRPRRGSGPGATWSCATDAEIANQAKNCSGADAWEMGKPNQPALHPWLEPATASVLITNGRTGAVSFDVTADVQAFLDGAIEDDGWIVKKDVEGQSGEIAFASRETGDGPTLVLTLKGDSTPPYPVSNIAAQDHNDGGGVTRVGWDTDFDQPNPDGSSGSGISEYRYRYQLNGADWTAWQGTTSTSFGLSGTSGSDVLNVDVTAVDADENESDPTSVSIAGIEFENTPTLELTQPFQNPTLTDAQKTAAISATESDPTLNQLLSGDSFTITQAEAWGQDTGPGLVGAQVTVTLDQPAAIEGDWPEVTYTGDSASPYVTAMYHLNLTNVTSVDAYVDPASGSVVGLEPDVGAEMLPGSASAAHAVRGARAVRATTATDQEDAADVGTGRATDTLHVVCPDNENCFMNFDFTTKAIDTNEADWNNVDWPVSIIWTGNSDVDTVKDVIRRYLGWHYNGGTMVASIAPHHGAGVYWTWDLDKGIKQDLCTGLLVKTPHMRVYAPLSDPSTGAADSFYSYQYGYYVIATTHFDWGECVSVPLGFVHISNHFGHAGYTERAEKLIGGDLALIASPEAPFVRSVTEDAIPLRNAEHFTKGDHVADNDGLATRIDLGLCQVSPEGCP